MLVANAQILQQLLGGSSTVWRQANWVEAGQLAGWRQASWVEAGQLGGGRPAGWRQASWVEAAGMEAGQLHKLKLSLCGLKSLVQCK